MSRHVVIAGDGDPCPRCGQPTEIREHKRITDRERRRPFYYARWSFCVNPRCWTTTITPEHQVWRVEPEMERRTANVAEQLGLPVDEWGTAGSSEVAWTLDDFTA